LAAKKYFVDLNLNKNQITEFSLENRQSNPALPVSGEIYYHSIDKKIKFYDGSSWQSIGEISADYLVYKGTIAHSASAPSSPKIGDVYVFSSSGTATNFGGAVVETGDLLIYNGSSWDIIQKNLNLQTATETETGLVEIATQNEANAGTDTARVITPATLDGYRLNKNLTSAIVFDNQTITVAGTTLTHNLATKNIVLDFYLNDEKIVLSYSMPTTNTVTVKSTMEISGVYVTVIGKKS
jgi:hypothetical protein